MPVNWQNREAHWAVSRTRLEALRNIFPADPNGEMYGALFNEFLENCEFGPALDALCDFLLEPDAPSPSETEFNEIAMLHALMEVPNDCLLRLRAKIQSSANSNQSGQDSFMTLDEALETVIDGINYAAYKETDSSLHDAEKNRLFGSNHYDSGRPIVKPSPWAEGDFEEKMTALLAIANFLNRSIPLFAEAQRLLENEESIIGRVIRRARHQHNKEAF